METSKLRDAAVKANVVCEFALKEGIHLQKCSTPTLCVGNSHRCLNDGSLKDWIRCDIENMDSPIFNIS